MACDLFTSFNHHFGFSLKLIFFKDFACSTASIVIKHAYFVEKKWLMSSKKLCLNKLEVLAIMWTDVPLSDFDGSQLEVTQW